jgi:hypothetical protein
MLWGILGIISAGFSLLPYLYFVLKGVTKPHIFTWVLWTMLTVIAFLVQFVGGAGPGAWATAFTAVLCALILIASLRYGHRDITLSDKITFAAALMAVPVWLVTRNPAAAAIWVTGIDALAYYPTIRKTWHRPHEEMFTAHAVANIKHIFSFLGMQSVSIATTFYPASLFVLNLILISVIGFRRRAVRGAA